MKRMVLVACMSAVLFGCGPKTYIHNEDQAIGTANLFLKAVVQEQYAQAYNKYMTDRAKKESGMSVTSFQLGFESIVDQYGPVTKAQFDSYLNVPNQPAIQLFYKVTHEQEGEVIYHIVMKGNTKTGYKVDIVDVGDTMAYPPGSIKVPPSERIRKTGVVEVQLK